MIRYRKGNSKRDLVGLVFLVAAATLLWVEHSMAREASMGEVLVTASSVVATIGPLDLQY